MKKKKNLDPETDVMDQFLDPETDVRNQFLDPDTEKNCQFLDGRPYTDVMDQFLDPETGARGTISLILIYLKIMFKSHGLIIILPVLSLDALSMIYLTSIFCL